VTYRETKIRNQNDVEQFLSGMVTVLGSDSCEWALANSGTMDWV